MSWSPKSVFSFPDWIPPFRDNQIATLCMALRSRRNSPSLQNTWRVRQAVADLYFVPVDSEEASDIMRTFFAAGWVNSYRVSNLMEEIRRERNAGGRGVVLTDDEF